MTKKKISSSQLQVANSKDSPQANSGQALRDQIDEVSSFFIPNCPADHWADLRNRAEEIVREKAIQSLENIEPLPSEEKRLTLHELRVYQIELELQNEELRRTQGELEASRTRYFNLYDLAPVGYVILSEKGLILEANLITATLLGVTRDELVKKPITRFILKGDQDLFYLFRKQLFETDAPQVCELRMVKQDKTTFWARLEATAAQESDGTSVCRITLSDITQRKQSEEALLESEKQYRTLFEAIKDTVFLIDQETGSILDVNPAATRMYGFNREEFLRMTTTDVSAEPEKISRATSEPVPFILLRYHRHKDGSVFPVELTASSFELREKNTIIATARDISNRKRAEADKEKLETQNRHLQKSESLGRMAGAIAHTFNNQLGVVIGNLELALMDLSQGAKPVNSLTTAMQAANKAAAVSGLMLTYLGQTPGKREPLDLSEACRRNLPIIEASLPGNVVLETDLPSPGPSTIANSIEIQQVLTNLITNAWEAVGEDGGSIHLRVKTVSLTEIPIVHRNPIDWQPQDNAYACLEVTDTGCGIAVEDIDKIFDPFFSSKFTGRGLGLSVVMGIVKAHGGVITVESEPRRGSALRVFFPLSAGEVLRQPDREAPTPVFEGGGTVLLVEDEEMVREMAAAMLTCLGFSVLEAKDGVEALEVFRQHQDEIRCVLADLTMPRMDGWETLTALRKLAPGIPVILASGYDKAHVMAGDHPELPQVFLGKPYNLKELSDAISQALVRRN